MVHGPAAERQLRTISTAGLIAILETEFQPHGEDAEILPELNDTRFAQRVHNLVCARWQRVRTSDKASDVLGPAPAIRHCATTAGARTRAAQNFKTR